jgi:hypothetical protein
LRWWVAPPVPVSGSYAPRLDARTTIVKSVQAGTTLTNTSLFETGGRTGARGVTQIIGGGRVGEAAMATLFFALVAVLWWRTRPPWALVAFCAGWAVLFFAPTLLSRNEQVYYHNDLVAAAAVLVGAIAARTSRGWRAAVVVALLLLALNAEISQRTMAYDWYHFAEQARPLGEIARHHPDAKRVVFVTAAPAEWTWVLTADGLAPFVPVLFGNRDLEVSVVDSRTFRGDSNALVIDVDHGMRER